MDVSGSRVGIVGGSIAGCGAAIGLGRLGCDVTVFERSSGALRDRGSGIAIPIPLRDDLIANGYLPADYACWRAVGRRWIGADGSDAGRTVWEQPGAAVTNNWGVLWRALRARVPDDRYRDGSHVVGVDETDGGVEVHLEGGDPERFDVVLGADGYRSLVRGLVHPGSKPQYAGYVLWRGNFPESQLSDRRAWDHILESETWLTVGFDGGHGIMYPIPEFAELGDGLRVNWAIYSPTPPDLELTGPSSIPPGAVDAPVYAHLERLRETAIPPDLQPVFAGSIEEVSIQPIYDETVDRYVRGHLALLGDAATLSRPHTGSGATKALQDARTLETLGAEHDTWESLLAAYDDDRTPGGQSLVELGRRIGRDQVEATPPWLDMTPDDFDAWTKGSLSGQQLYFYGGSDD
ncbi:MAG: FAD-dependent monooxygenase [Ilumatobacteraceae bacterium]